METKFSADKRGGNFLAALLGVLGLSYIFISLANGTFIRSVPIFVSYCLLVAILYVAFNMYTYITFNENLKSVKTSFLFFTRTIKISNIVNIYTTSTYSGTITNVTIVYIDKNGKRKKVNTMSKESFMKGDFERFIKIVTGINPAVNINL